LKFVFAVSHHQLVAGDVQLPAVPPPSGLLAVGGRNLPAVIALR
jgi:hypothetical protein